MNEKRIRLLLAKPGAFPAIEIAAAAPAVVVDDEHVIVPPDFATPTLTSVWARELSETVKTHTVGVRALDAGAAAPWTHWLRVIGNEGEAATVDFVVEARGLPTGEREAREHGHEYGELEVTIVEAWEAEEGPAQ